ncbi:MAG: CRISPR-associated endonuclease Cas2 [Clostridiales bacterium]|nr:CRISPR-associated endonuclease Cas2 [Clostridiales bacterium]
MYIVSYDISFDRLRAKVAKTMEGFGVRVQYSVFECRLDERRFSEMYRKLAELTSEMDDGSVRFYKICGKCEQEIRVIGETSASQALLKEDIVVV